jgi:phosphate acetyltransferase
MAAIDPKNESAIPFYDRLCRVCKDHRAPLKTAVVHPVDVNAIEGAVAAAEEGILLPILIGPEERIRQAAKEGAFDISGFELIPTEHSHAAAQKAAQLAREGEVDAIMKGHLHTDELMHAMLERKNNLRTGRRMSHVFVVDVPLEHYPKPLFLSDAAINIKPTLADKKDIIQNAIDLFRACGFGMPNVAILSATEQITDHLPSTVEGAALCKMAERGDITGGILDGPLAFDNAVSKEAAEAKHLRSDVAGNADILIVPDIESGNMLYKQMRYLSGYNAAGLVMGARVPIILTSRAGGKMARLASAALAMLYAYSDEAKHL